ncbi:lipid-A-disaccharide synthase, partial [Bacteroidia bacterium]|nr:lipid-A-disaccharide synthase [Bacteroidia bacterium]
QEYFAKRGVAPIYVGNPSKETVDEFLGNNKIEKKHKSIALLPGSRTQEIKSSLPIMLEAMKNFEDYELLVAQAPGFDDEFYYGFDSNLKLIKNDMYTLLAQSEAALVTSGTATLETALMNVPQIVCYKASAITYAIAKRVIKLKYISLVNLILDRDCVTELIQGDFNPNNISSELNNIFNSAEKKNQIAYDYKELHRLIGESHPSQRVAQLIHNSL